MKLEHLIKIVEETYFEIFKQKPQQIIKMSELVYEVRFSNEKIKVDRSVGNKYRLTFDSYEGTIDKFRDFLNQFIDLTSNCCDTGYFIDLTEHNITIIYDYLFIKE